jgi:hypothetical protein
MAETTDTILAMVRTRAMLNTSDPTFTDAKLLQFINRDLTGFIMPLVNRYNEEYYVSEISIPLVADQYLYPLPTIAFMQKVRHIELKRTDGDNRLLPRIEVSDAHFYQGGGTSPSGYHLQGKFIKLLPDDGDWNTSESLTISIIKRPNKLVAENRAATIASYTATTLTLNAAFGDGTIAATDNFDVLSATSGFESLLWDLNPDTLVTTTVTFPAGTFSTTDNVIVAGDYLNVTGESIVPQCPEEFLDIIVERCAMRVFQSLGDQQGAAAASSSINELTEALDIMLASREGSKPAKIYNQYSILRGGRRPSRRVLT